MPNHTDNRIILEHKDPKEITYIWEIFQLEDTPFCQMIIPMPRELENTTSPCPEGVKQPVIDGHDNWYDWRVEHWGTKWDIYDADCERIDDNTLQIYFSSAWSPPVPVFERLVDMGFDIDARYLDEGWMFIGQFTAQDGVVDDYCTSDVENVKEDYPELDDEFGISETLEEQREEANG